MNSGNPQKSLDITMPRKKFWLCILAVALLVCFATLHLSLAYLVRVETVEVQIPIWLHAIRIHTELKFAVPIYLDKEKGVWVVQTHINEHKARLMIDTGAWISFVSKDFAKKAAIKETPDSPLEFSTHMGVGQAPSGIVNSLKIGNIEFSKIMFAVHNNFSDIEGILGMDVLECLKPLFDYDKSTMWVSYPQKRGGCNWTS